MIYLALNATSTEWKRSVREWHALRSQPAIMFKDRFPIAEENASGTKFRIVFALDMPIRTKSGNLTVSVSKASIGL
ncbi:hypothetical protein [Thioclava indica]|uniref:hypothetical protein n=1 Tax=Thioclava indica TaxID=1353528 RepID=UPI000689E269|nr:hypothetical protein [Thioclava indica]